MPQALEGRMGALGDWQEVGDMAWGGEAMLQRGRLRAAWGGGSAARLSPLPTAAHISCSGVFLSWWGEHF